ncbi:MAG TPA: hypothetical protein DEG71_00665 [Clostridiales bacterium]|nr:hypothetical protein [Clostridiales bacterium]
MAKKNLYTCDQCYYTDTPDYGKYILKCGMKEIAKFDTEPTVTQIDTAIKLWKDSALNDTTMVYDGEERIKINISDIKEFGISNQKTWTVKGKFKTWWKRYYIRTTDGMFCWIYEEKFTVLKERLNGKYTKEKYTKSEYKNYLERKATDWIFKMIV